MNKRYNGKLAMAFRRHAIRFLLEHGCGFEQNTLAVKNKELRERLASHFPDAPKGKNAQYAFYCQKLGGETIPYTHRASPRRRMVGQVFYNSDDWRRVRYEALKRGKGCCDCCGARPTTGNPLHVDHIKPRSRFPELELDVANLQVLCRDCNLGKSARDATDWRDNVIALNPAQRAAEKAVARGELVLWGDSWDKVEGGRP
jgi:5-methylcytosine-specific restriction endonuclease McrA